jgi:hypothetical protein
VLEVGAMRTLAALLVLASLVPTVARAGDTWRSVRVDAGGTRVRLVDPRGLVVVTSPTWARALRRHDGHELLVQLPASLERQIEAITSASPAFQATTDDIVAVRWTEDVEVSRVDDELVILETRAGARVGEGPGAAYLSRRFDRRRARVCIEDRNGRVAGRVHVVTLEDDVALEVGQDGRLRGDDRIQYTLDARPDDSLPERPGARAGVRVQVREVRGDGAELVAIGSVLEPAPAAPAPTRGLVGAVPGR